MFYTCKRPWVYANDTKIMHSREVQCHTEVCCIDKLCLKLVMEERDKMAANSASWRPKHFT